MTVLFDGLVETDYGQFDLIWAPDGIGFDGDFDKFFDGQTNGLVGAANHEGVYFCLARRSGGSHVRIELCKSEHLGGRCRGLEHHPKRCRAALGDLGR